MRHGSVSIVIVNLLPRPFARIIDEIANHLLEILAFAREIGLAPAAVSVNSIARVRIDFFECADQGLGGRGHLGDAAKRSRPDRDPGAIKVIGHLIAHDRRLLLNLRRERALIRRGFVDDHAERRFQRMREIANLGARALHHIAIGADQQIEFARKRRQILRKIAFDFLGFARA